MAEFTAVPGLDSLVARMVAPEVHKIARQVEIAARRLAPPGKKWVAVMDARTRDTHREAHGHPQIPGNLRFAVRGQPWDIAHGASPGIDYLRYPRDESTGLVASPQDDAHVQHRNCRCVVALDPAAIASKIHTSPAYIYGPIVRVEVTCTAYKVVQAEYGETYPGGVTSPGTHFMGRAAARVAGSGGYGPSADQLAGAAEWTMPGAVGDGAAGSE